MPARSPMLFAGFTHCPDICPNTLALLKSLGLDYAVRPRQGGGEQVDHSAAVVVIDPQARAKTCCVAPRDAWAMASDLARLIEGGRA